MEFTHFLTGLLIGVSIAAPVGPIGVLCIRRTLASGRLVGLVSGLGAATADSLYSCVAAFGLTFISNFLLHQQFWLRLVGGIFLCLLGIKTIFSVPEKTTSSASHLTLFNSYASTLFLTLTNPLTILAFAAVFAGLGVVEQSDYTKAAIIVLGVFLGSSCWWILLSTVIHLLRARFRPRGLLWVNRISGLVILGFGIFALAGLVFNIY